MHNNKCGSVCYIDYKGSICNKVKLVTTILFSFSLPPHRCMLTLYRSQESLSMVGSKWLFKSRHLERVLKILLRYSQMELLNSVLAWSLVSEYNLWTSTKRDLYINVYNAYQPSLGLGTTRTSPYLGLGTTRTDPYLGLGTTRTDPYLGISTIGVYHS